MAAESLAAAESDDGIVGRSAGRGILLRAADGARQGTPSVVVIDGDAGAGKTELARWLARRAPDFAPIWLSAATASAPPRLALVGALADELRRRSGEAGLADLAPLDAEHSAHSIASVLASALDALQARLPVLLVLDRVENADRESMEALSHLLRRLDGGRVVALVMGRDAPDRWKTLLHVSEWRTPPERLTLEPFGLAEIRSLVPAGTPAPERVAARILRQTGGNPLYVRTLLEHRDAEGRVDTSTVPASLGAAIRLNLSSCSDEEVRALSALAVLGEPAPARAVAEVAGLPSVVASLERLVELGLVEWAHGPAGEDQVAFRSEAYRDAVYGGLPPSARLGMHAVAAQSAIGSERWRHRVGATEGADPLLAAELEEAASREADGSKAAEYLLWARRLGGGAADTQRRLLDAVRLLVLASHESDALHFESAVEKLPPSPRRSEALALLAFSQSRITEARDHLAAAAAELDPAAHPELAARIEVELAYVYSMLGFGEQAVAAATRAIAETTQPQLVAAAKAFKANGTALVDGVVAGLSQLDDLPAMPSECGPMQLPELTQRGILRGLLGRLDEAAADLTVVTRRRGGPFGRLLGASPFIHLVWCDYALGRWDEAERTLAVGFDSADQRARSFDRPVLHSLAAILAASRGERELALASLAEATRLAAAADYLGPIMHLSLARAVIAQADGDYGDVVDILGGISPASVNSHRFRLYAAWWLPTLAGAQIVVGRFEEANRNLIRLAQTPAEGPWLSIAEAWLRGRLAEAQGDAAGARRSYLRGVNAPITAADPRWYRALLLNAYGQFAVRSGDRATGLAALASAAQLFGRLGARPFLDRCNAEIARLGEPQVTDWMRLLTDREREIADLVGRGWTNPEIARELYVSPKTIQYHLRNVYNKLGLASRRQLRDAVHGIA